MPSNTRHLYLPAMLVGLALILSACQRQSAPEMREVAPGRATAAASSTTDTPTARPAATAGRTTVTAPAEPTGTRSDGGTASPETALTPSATAGEAASPTASRPPAPGLPGALITVQLDSQVGVLLDELPEELRDGVAERLEAQPESFWQALAQRQVRLTKRRLNFRNFNYEGRGQLPLPPEELWTIRLDPAGPSRSMVGGHDLVLIGYRFTSTLLTDINSPAEAEPALADVGGQWQEPFILPLDPDLLLQRTGNACLNEAGFPPNSIDSENAWLFFDHGCVGDSGGALGCHRTLLNTLSCVEALNAVVGVVETEVRFRRIAWNARLADQVRVGEVTHAGAPDLMVFGQDLENYKILYRYFPTDSCALVEHCVGGSGWRRLLQFDATIHNVGGEALHIGPVVNQNPGQTLFQYNACHAHYHFSNYGDFFLNSQDQTLSSKQAFCVESTNRFSNNEYAPLTQPYRCLFQGVQAGWVDEYKAGLDCQWIDITEVELPAENPTVSLGFTSNPDRFLCEGTQVVDDDGNPVWEPTDLANPLGGTLLRPVCDFVPDWDANNHDSREITIPEMGSFVTAPCAEGQVGPLRNCGFSEQLSGVTLPEGVGLERDGDDRSRPALPFGCTPGQPVQMSCTLEEGNAPQVLRICEYSEVLGVGLACTFLESLANVIVGQEPAAVSFTCPFARDAAEPGGHFSAYTAPLFDQDDGATVTCTASR